MKKNVRSKSPIRQLSLWLGALVDPFLTRNSLAFTYLNMTQFLGALNDNIFKMLIVFFIIQMEGIQESSRILAMAGAIFVIPFILFSSPSGILADHASKTKVIIFTKLLEFFIMTFGVLVFYAESVIGGYVVLFLMATQSAIFGPSKYGIIPEIVSSDRISRANGMLSSFTFLAIILGSSLASLLTDVTHHHFVLCSLFCMLVSVVGLATSLLIPYTPPASPKGRRRPALLIAELYESVLAAMNVPSLMAAVFASSYFLFTAAFFQLNIIPLAVQSLGLTDVQGGYLFPLIAIGIGVGSIVSGTICGNRVELGLIPLSAFGITLGCFFIDLFSESLFLIIPLITTIGFLGGLFVIPADSYIQMKSPSKMRGKIVAMANFFSFIGVLLSSLFLYILAEILHLPADRCFMVIGCVNLVMVCVLFYSFTPHTVRFVSMLYVRALYRISVENQVISNGKGSLFLLENGGFKEMLALLASQREVVSFFYEERALAWHEKILFRLVGAQPLMEGEEISRLKERLHRRLKKGRAICFVGSAVHFVRGWDQTVPPLAGVDLVELKIETAQAEVGSSMLARWCSLCTGGECDGSSCRRPLAVKMVSLKDL